MLQLTHKKAEDLLSRVFSALAEGDAADEHADLLRELHAVLAPGSRGNARAYYARWSFGGVPGKALAGRGARL